MQPDSSPQVLRRDIDWKGAFWAASGCSTSVLITTGAIAGLIGRPSWIVWIASILMGFVQSFVYAEIAGLYPHKSGGASVYGAAAWLPYSKYIAPVSVWCNWLAWSPVLALATGVAATYILNLVFPESGLLRWHVELLPLDFIKAGLTLRINATAIVASVLLFMTFALQHHGVLRAARLQRLVAIACLAPLLIVGIVPIVTGRISMGNLFPLLPLTHGADGVIGTGDWNAAGITLLMGGMFTAAWSTYAFETAVCYTREFRNPESDTYRAVLSSGLLCITTYTIVPLAFQGVLGINTLLDPALADGSGVAVALASLVRGGPLITRLIVVFFIFALLLLVMSSMMGSSRTLYQASADGWLPRYLSRVNQHGAPTAAMWTDLAFNLVLLLMSDYFFVLLVSNVCYLLFNFLNLQAGWIHRIDRPDWPRPFRCPTWLLVSGAVFGFVNLLFVGAGADALGAGALRSGLIATTLIVPVFVYRHYVQDRGQFPTANGNDQLRFIVSPDRRAAGLGAYLALAVGIVVLWLGHACAVYEGRPM